MWLAGGAAVRTRLIVVLFESPSKKTGLASTLAWPAPDRIGGHLGLEPGSTCVTQSIFNPRGFV